MSGRQCGSVLPEGEESDDVAEVPPWRWSQTSAQTLRSSCLISMSPELQLGILIICQSMSLAWKKLLRSAAIAISSLAQTPQGRIGSTTILMLTLPSAPLTHDDVVLDPAAMQENSRCRSPDSQYVTVDQNHNLARTAEVFSVPMWCKFAALMA